MYTSGPSKSTEKDVIIGIPIPMDVINNLDEMVSIEFTIFEFKYSWLLNLRGEVFVF